MKSNKYLQSYYSVSSALFIGLYYLTLTMKLKKIGLTAISMVMLFSTAMSNLSIVSAKQIDVLIREYETGYKTDKGTNLLKLRIKSDDIPDYETKK